MQSEEQKSDLFGVFEKYFDGWKSLDYVAGWFMKAAEYGTKTNTVAAFVSTNSICQGQQVPLIWPLIFGTGHEITFAHTSFKWANLASYNAGVTVTIIAISMQVNRIKRLFQSDDGGLVVSKEVDKINAYLVPGESIYVKSSSNPQNGLPTMDYGSKPADGGGLVLSLDQKRQLGLSPEIAHIVMPYIGSEEFIEGKQRYCLWIDESNLSEAIQSKPVKSRIDSVKSFREKSKRSLQRKLPSDHIHS